MTVKFEETGKRGTVRNKWYDVKLLPSGECLPNKDIWMDRQMDRWKFGVISVNFEAFGNGALYVAIDFL